MDWHAYIRAGARAGHTPDADIVEELAQHAATAFEAHRADGLDPAAAEARVRQDLDRSIDDAAAFRPRPRRPPAVAPPPVAAPRLVGLWHDVRYGLRLLRRQPGFACVALLTIALGVGATSTLASVTYAVLVKPLPWPGADRLVRVYESREGGSSSFGPVMTNGPFHAWREQASTIEGIAAWTSRVMTLAGDGVSTDRVTVAGVTASLFPLLRAVPDRGALFGDADEAGAAVVVVSQAFWQTRMGGSPDVVGRVIRLDNRAVTIVGVMPASFTFPDRATSLWIPYRVPPVEDAATERRSVSMFEGMARLRDGATAGQASLEGTSRARAIPDLSPMMLKLMGGGGPAKITAVPMLDDLTHDVKPALLVLLAAVGLLFAAATANVASMQAARVAARRQEVAIRAAIGAGLGRLARQLLVESALLGLLGGALGGAVAMGLLGALPHLLPADFPRRDDLGMDARVLGVAILLSVVASVLVGLLPMLQARRLNLVEALTENGQAAVGGGRRSRVARTRALIMAGQMAIATTLLVGAVLLGRSFVALVTTDRGYAPAHVLTARVLLTDTSASSARRTELFDQILTRIGALPGVTHVGLTTILPLTPRESSLSFAMPGLPGAADTGGQVQANARQVSPEYFAALGLRVSEGRGFTDEDTTTSEPVVVVNRTFARRYLGESALGAALPAALDRGHDDRNPWRVVGIVDDVRQQGLLDPVRPEVYVSHRQQSSGPTSSQFLVVRAAGDPLDRAGDVRQIVLAADTSAAVESLMTMEDRVLASVARPRLYALLLGGFATFALGIAAIGLVGVLSSSVAQRVREIGVRTALGARPLDIARLVIGQGLAMTTAGLVVGLVVAGVLVRSIATFLYGVTTHDPVTFLAVAAALMVVSACACAVPAIRAARIDPLKALRWS